MAHEILSTDPRLTWQGAASLETNDDWVLPWRIPHEQALLFEEGLRERARTTVGVRLSFVSDTIMLAGVIEPSDGEGAVDLYIDGEMVGTEDITEKERFGYDNLKPGKKTMELWLPVAQQFRLRSLSLSDGAALEPFQDDRPKWITYGSSITHCGAAESPSMTWPGVVARAAGYNLTCFGFGGQCHLDALVAMTMCDLPADYLSMCVGINIMGGGTLNIRTFRSSIIGFVRIVREKHLDTPFVVMSPIISKGRETVANSAGMHLVLMRQEVQAAVDVLRDCGDDNVHYVDGLDVMGAEQAHLLPDDLHPGPEGYKVMGQRFLDYAARPYFGAA